MPGDRDEPELEVELRQAAARFDPVPPALLQAAAGAFSWRTIDAELAELTFDSLVDQDELALVRGPAQRRLLSFQAGGLAIDLEVTSASSGRELVGQLAPPQQASVEIRSGTGVVVIEADELGGPRRAGAVRPMSLRCRPDRAGPGRWSLPTGCRSDRCRSDWRRAAWHRPPRADGFPHGVGELPEEGGADVRRAEHLGMPLHGDQEPGAVALDRLDDAVRRAAGHPQPRRQAADGLMVQGVNADLGAEQPVQQRSRLQPDRMSGPVPGLQHQVPGAGRIGGRQVLGERAAQRDIHQLDAAADRQHRDVLLAREPDERDLDLVALGVDVLGRRLAGSGVPGGIDVAAAGQHQAVDAVEQARDSPGSLSTGISSGASPAARSACR